MAGSLGGRQCLFGGRRQRILDGTRPSHRQAAADGRCNLSHLAIRQALFHRLADFAEDLLDDFLAIPEEDDSKLAAAVAGTGDVEPQQVFANNCRPLVATLCRRKCGRDGR